MISVQLDLEEEQAWALAQLIKRIGWTEIRANATGDEEAFLMRDALGALQGAMAMAGAAPR